METVTRRGIWSNLRGFLPEGKALPEPAWEARHRFVLLFIWAHAVGLAIFGLVRGWGPAYSLGEGGLIAAIGLLASWKRLSRPFRSGVAAFAAASSSAVLTQFSGGYIEAHFHYFIVVALIALYQDWVPFLLAIGYVAVDHGLIGSLAPTWVYNHPAAVANPWTWAAIHAVLVLGECGVLIALWKANERSRARSDLVLNSAGEGILGLDLGGNVRFANPAAAKMLGHPETALIGRSIGRVLDAKAEEGLGAFRFVAENGYKAASGQLIVDRAGAPLPLDWTLNPVSEHGMSVGLVLTLMDASQRQRAEEERSKRLQQVGELERLKELDKFKTLFINTAAHELHTPLTPLRLHVFALKEGHRGELNPEQLSAVEVLDRNVERLSSLVEDVLNAARLQANRMLLRRAPTDMAHVAHEAVDAFQESARAAGIALESKLAPGIMVDADAKRLNQVLYNLLDNAVKFTPKGGRIVVEVDQEHDAARCRITDTGVGIPREEIVRLFQPFVQAHDPMEQTRVGSGLGLYISRGIIELHGGKIACESAGRGQGSTFTFLLPVIERTVRPATLERLRA